MNAIGFRNLRSLRNTPDLQIRPITVLVGANSSGKSTFLRALPLLRQSFEARKASPVLWYGRFVDFGSFRETVFLNDETSPIQFRFSFSYQDSGDDDDLYQYGGYAPVSVKTQEITVSVDISGTDKEFRGYSSQVTVVTGGDTVTVGIALEGRVPILICNGVDVTSQYPQLISIARGNLIPKVGRLVERQIARADGQNETTKVFTSSGIATERIIALLRPFFSGRTKDSTVRDLVRRLLYGTPEDLISQIEKQVGGQRVLQKRLKALTNNAQLIESLRAHLIINSLPRWLEAAENEVSTFASSVSYIAPVRASTERYYRAQDLAVDEVDPQGENIPMFLQTLSPTDRDGLSEWLTKHFNFSVVADYSSGHVSLKYKDPDQDRVYNLADMGFGFSQILPILVQIWAQGNLKVRRLRRERSNAPRLFAIEQPELHLHPRLQAKFSDLLCSVTTKEAGDKRTVRFLIETHSEAMINRFGCLVRDGKLKPSDICVVVFERNAQSQETSLRIAEYDNAGLLKNWPYGFFSSDSE